MSLDFFIRLRKRWSQKIPPWSSSLSSPCRSVIIITHQCWYILSWRVYTNFWYMVVSNLQFQDIHPCLLMQLAATFILNHAIQMQIATSHARISVCIPMLDFVSPILIALFPRKFVVVKTKEAIRLEKQILCCCFNLTLMFSWAMK